MSMTFLGIIYVIRNGFFEHYIWCRVVPFRHRATCLGKQATIWHTFMDRVEDGTVEDGVSYSLALPVTRVGEV